MLSIRYSFTPSEDAVLAYFLDYPERQFYSLQLSLFLGLSAGAVHAALKRLYTEGLVQRTQQGRTVLYHLDDRSSQLRSLKIAHSLRIVLPLLKQISPWLREAYLFGSSATGRYLSKSDIDLALICRYSEDKKRIRNTLFRYRTRRTIQPQTFTLEEFTQLQQKDAIFYQEIVGGINLLNRLEDEPEL